MILRLYTFFCILSKLTNSACRPLTIDVGKRLHNMFKLKSPCAWKRWLSAAYIVPSHPSVIVKCCLISHQDKFACIPAFRTLTSHKWFSRLIHLHLYFVDFCYANQNGCISSRGKAMSRRQVTVGKTLHPDLKTSDTDVILTPSVHKARQRHASKCDGCVSGNNEHLCETTLLVMWFCFECRSVTEAYSDISP
jgi:hypothetical protein